MLEKRMDDIDGGGKTLELVAKASSLLREMRTIRTRVLLVDGNPFANASTRLQRSLRHHTYRSPWIFSHCPDFQEVSRTWIHYQLAIVYKVPSGFE